MEVKQDSCQLKSEVDSELTKVRHFGNYLVYFILTHFQEPPQEGISSNLKSELELTKVSILSWVASPKWGLDMQLLQGEPMTKF